MKHYPHHIGDFDKATRHLTRIERSVYRDLIDLYYDTEKPLTLDKAALCRRIIARTNEESTAVEQVLNEFFTETPTGWYHARCEQEIEAYQANTSQKAMAGKASAEAKRLKKLQALNGNSTPVEQPLNPVGTADNGTPTNQSTNQPSTNQPIDGSALQAPKPAKRATQIPVNFYPDETGVGYAEERRLTLAVEMQSFRNHHQAKGSTFKDWQAAWRTWCDKAVEFGRAVNTAPKQALSFAERDEQARRKRWEEMTGRKWPESYDPTTIDATTTRPAPLELEQ